MKEKDGYLLFFGWSAVFLFVFIFFGPEMIIPGTFFDFGDIVYPYFPGNFLTGVDTLWKNFVFGSPELLRNEALLYNFLLSGSYFVPSWVLNRLFVFLPIVIAVWAVMFFCLRHTEKFKMTAILGGGFFLLSAPVFYVIGNSKIMLSLAAFVLGLLTMESGLLSRNFREVCRYAILLGLLSLLGGASIHFYVYAFFAYPLFIVSCLVFFRGRIKKYGLLFLPLSLLLVFLLNLYWLLPFFKVNGLEGIINLEGVGSDFSRVCLESTSRGINDRLGRMGLFNINDFALSRDVLRSAIVSAVALAGLILEKKNRVIVLPFLFMLFLSTGVYYGPARDFIFRFWNIFPLIQCVRDANNFVYPSYLFVSMAFGTGLARLARQAWRAEI